MGGGGMGGMGGGMGGMGGGMRSVPPTGLPHATLKPGQTRQPADPAGQPDRPRTPTTDRRRHARQGREAPDRRHLASRPATPGSQTALKRLADDKAPETVAQLVMWNVASALDWDAIAELSKELGQRPRADAWPASFVDQLDNLPEGETGSLLYEITRRRATTATPWPPS